MALYHHDARDYSTAAEAAAVAANRKLQAIIAQGKATAGQAFEAIFNRTITDAMVRGAAPSYSYDGHKLTMQIEPNGAALAVTDHAFGQVLDRAGVKVPGHFARKLLSHPSEHVRALLPELIETVNRCDKETANERSLVRVCDGEVRAVLSDRYKRIDSRPMLGAFALAGAQHGLVPIMGCNSQVKDHFRMLLPTIFEPVKNEPMCFGLEWSNSDYGGGPNTVKLIMLRLWCTNTAIAENILRQVHLGRTIEDLESDVVSDRTRQLAEDTAASAMQDIFSAWIAPERVQQYVSVIARASATEIHPEKALSEMVKKGQITSAERDNLIKLDATKDVEILPPVRGQNSNVWRFSNLFSFAAQQTVNVVRARELEVIAGNVLATYVPANQERNLLALPAYIDAAAE